MFPAGPLHCALEKLVFTPVKEAEELLPLLSSVTARGAHPGGAWFDGLTLGCMACDTVASGCCPALPHCAFWGSCVASQSFPLSDS